MTDVRINLSADPTSASSALRRVQDDMRRLSERVRELGAAGKGVDLSAGAEDAAKHLEQVKRQYQDLLALNNDLRRRLEMSGQQGAAPWDIDWDRMGYLNRRTQEEARRRVIEQSARGTPWQLPPGGGGGRSGGSSASSDDNPFGGMLGG